MSLFNRRWLLIGILPLLSCGFEPIYGTNKPADLIMGKIDVEVSNGRNAFEFRERLIERLGALDGTPTYLLKYTSNIKSKNLTISKDNDAVTFTVAAVTVPVNVGPAVFALVALAVARLLNSVSISVPLTILLGSPELRESLVAKLVVFV